MSEQKTETKAKIETPVSWGELSQRYINILKKAGYESLADVQKLSKEELLKVKGIGEAVADKILGNEEPVKKAPKTKAKKTQEAIADQVEPREDDQEPYVVMERFDEQQILADIDGQISQMADEMVYYFKDKNGKEITGLSWVGTKAASYHMRQKKVVNLSVESIDYEPDPIDKEFMIFKVKIKDLMSNAQTIAMKRQDLYIRPKKGNPYPNPFWLEVGRSKAVRNGMQDLMPADWMAKMIKTWIDEGKVKILGSGSNKNSSALPGQSVKKISPVLNKINGATTLDVLDKAKQYINTTDSLNGQEKNFLMKVINKKEQQLKK